MATFRASVRTVDMLGRQQIAGIPTAISELFKNAHDAYATQVEVDFYRPERLLILRDDGLGMTLDDIRKHWLVLGTESQLTGRGDLAGIAATRGLSARIPMGEKGIGRLSIAAIGPQVLLLTRAQRRDGLRPTVALFVNWSLFELPGIGLDEIDVPIKEFPSDYLPTADDVQELVARVQRNMDRLRPRVNPDEADWIDQQLRQVAFDPKALQRRFQNSLLSDPVPGTQFYIQPVVPVLEEELDESQECRHVGDLHRTLVGFTNTMIPDGRQAPIATAFREHLSADFSRSVIGPEEFFTPEEFKSADHHIQGAFDEFGQFAGTVSVYGQEPERHAISWPSAQGQKTQCGPFDIRFAYVQGVARESRMPRAQRAALVRKLARMGGLYVYRNGIRILPYGSPDYDFLQIEERRTFSAGYYFFSYRRLFGIIDLPPESKKRLAEKAGREGFRENAAYRQFRAILVNFFIQLAADYFRDEAARGAHYRLAKADLDRQAHAREHQRQRSRAQRRSLSAALTERSIQLDGNAPHDTVENAVRKCMEELKAVQGLTDPDAQYRTIIHAVNKARQRISEVQEEYRIQRPQGIGLPPALRRDLNAYRAGYSRLVDEVCKPAVIQIENAFSGTIRGLKIDVDRHQQFEDSARVAWTLARSQVKAREQAAQASLRQTSARVRHAVREAMLGFELTLEESAQRLQQANLPHPTEAEIVQLRLDLATEIESVAQKKKDLLDTVSQQLEAIIVAPDGSGRMITPLDIAGAQEEEMLALQEQAEADLELTQLGMAIEIINHEFQATIQSIRNHLRRLQAWADVNPQLSDVYRGIRNNFEHLDSYLALFTPLHRRLYGKKIKIKGNDIGRFLFDLFGKRFERHRIAARTTPAFRSYSITGYPSTFYPVFVNLVDNAVFWLQDQPLPRSIVLDANGRELLVADSGPGVSQPDREVIFEMGFTRKPGGRGLGLHIARDVLRKVGWELAIGEAAERQGTVFIIRPEPDNDP